MAKLLYYYVYHIFTYILFSYKKGKILIIASLKHA